MTVFHTSGGGVKYAWHKVSRGKYIELLSTPTSLKDDCKKGKYNGLVSQPTRHCEARRGNPVGITPSGFQPPAWLLALNGNFKFCYETLSLVCSCEQNFPSPLMGEGPEGDEGGYYINCNAMLGLWFAVANNVALACCKICC